MSCAQGWTESWDFWNVETRCLLAGVLGSIKIFNDRLLQPKNASEAYQMCANVLVQAIKKNWKFSSVKFHVCPRVTFSGLLLT